MRNSCSCYGEGKENLLKKINKTYYPLEGLRQEPFKFSEICFGVLP